MHHTNLDAGLGVGGGRVERHGERRVAIGRDRHRILGRLRARNLVVVVHPPADPEHVDGGRHCDVMMRSFVVI